MARYRATRNEPRVGIGDWTGDFRKGNIYESGEGFGKVPEHICDYLVSHGILVDVRVSDKPMESPQFTSPIPPTIIPLDTKRMVGEETLEV